MNIHKFSLDPELQKPVKASVSLLCVCPFAQQREQKVKPQNYKILTGSFLAQFVPVVCVIVPVFLVSMLNFRVPPSYIKIYN